MKTDAEFIERFRRVYLEEFGEEISREEAYDNFFCLPDVLRIIRQPLTQQGEGLSSPIDGGHGNDRLEKPG